MKMLRCLVRQGFCASSADRQAASSSAGECEGRVYCSVEGLGLRL